MSDREGSYKTMDHDHSPRRDYSPRNHKEKSYSRSPSRDRGDRDRRRDDRDYSSRLDRSPSRGRGRDRDRRRDDREYSSRRDRSRSRSCSDRRYKSSRYSRSISHSSGYRRSDSHSPMSSRRRHMGTRDNPKPTYCLGVFGLNVHTTEDELYSIFSKYGAVERVQVVIDAKTGRSRGFAFVYFQSVDDAKAAKDQCTGMKINGKSIRVDFSITERAHTPTPGIYMGKPTYKYDRYEGRGRRDRDRDDYYRSSRYRRSPSPYYSSRSRRRYSRSRSYSPPPLSSAALRTTALDGATRIHRRVPRRTTLSSFTPTCDVSRQRLDKQPPALRTAVLLELALSPLPWHPGWILDVQKLRLKDNATLLLERSRCEP